MNSTPDLAGLLAHAGWVRKLARSLTRDPEAASDLEQNAWLAALSAPLRSVRDPRAWLGGVVRRLARQETRSELHRGDRERRAAHGEALAGSDELAERVELSSLLAKAVLDLDEPYRTTVILRHYEGLPPRRIAARLGVDVRAVETRLRRAHERLRTRLDDVHAGDREAWFPGVLALGLSAGGEALSGVGLTAAAAVLIAAGAGIGWVLRAGPQPHGPLQDSAPVLVAAHEQPLEDAPEQAAPAAVGARREAGLPAEVAVPRELELVVVRADDGAPLAQLEIQIGGAGWSRDGAHVTDDEGRVHVSLTEGMRVPRVSIPATDTTQGHELRLPGLGEQRVRVPARGGVLAGRVLGLDGGAIPFARVQAWRNVGRAVTPRTPDLETLCDGAGRFRLEQLAGPRGGRQSYVLIAEADGLASAHALKGAVDERCDELELTIFVTAARHMRGRVVDAAGNPVSGVPMHVYADWRGENSLKRRLPADFKPASRWGRPSELPQLYVATELDGSFKLDVAALPWHIQVDSPDHMLWMDWVDSEEFVEIRLEWGGLLTGVVLDAGGAPLAGASVRIQGRDKREPVTTGDDGAFRFEGLSPLEGALLLVSHPGAAFHVQTVDLTGTEAHAEVRLETARRISGRVLDAAGLPVRGALVELRGDRRIDSPWLPRHRGFLWETMHRPPYESTRADGSFQFENLYSGRYSLRVRTTQQGQVEAFARLDLGAEEPAPIELVLGSPLTGTLSLQGQAVRADDGRPLARFTVRASYFVEGESEPAQSPVQQFVDDPSGFFELRGLEPGTWQVTVSSIEGGVLSWSSTPERMGPGSHTLEARLAATER